MPALRSKISIREKLIFNLWLTFTNRVIYASSIHAISGYPADQQVRESDPVNPGDIYGVSKCFSGNLISKI
jgi:nucleoside-diphosphate-sugar epimerase